ncbi:MAG: hypothetical protein HYZ81_08770 [Nitrospinae bacterium]|nr:hypothetical protein [Nitrospinota bacterium]
MPPSFPPAAYVAKKMITAFGDRLHEKTICLTTPVPKLVPLWKAKPRPALRKFLTKYEQRVATNGLYAHQAEVVKALKSAKIPNVVMTTATGSGKSLAFLAWAFEILAHDKEADFLSHLAGVILDEAHSWHGLSGANVRAMIDRLRLSMDVLGVQHPSFFLASATLADAATFAEDLTGVPAASFFEVNDKGAAKASLVSTKEVPALLAQPAEPGLLRRYVLLVDPEPEPLGARDVLGKADHLGPGANALCFVQSKFVGHRLQVNRRLLLMRAWKSKVQLAANCLPHTLYVILES